MLLLGIDVGTSSVKVTVVDAQTQQSKVPGLFACGEAAAGLHGANRLGGNSLSDLIVFGKLAGTGAAEYVRKLSSAPITDSEEIKKAVRRATEILNRESGTNPYLVHEELQETMQNNVGIIRQTEELKTALSDIEKLKKDASNVKANGSSQFNPGWHEALSLSSLLTVSQAVTMAALMREESRGAHTRLEFEGEREEWGKVNIVVRKGADGKMEVEKIQRPEPPAELAAIAMASLEELEGTGSKK